MNLIPEERFRTGRYYQQKKSHTQAHVKGIMTMQYRLQKIIAMLCLLLILASLSACGGKSNTTRQMAKPTVGPGQHLLEETGNLLKNAHTLHGIFDGSISGRLISGEMESEIWRMAPNQSRALILKSTLSQFTPGTLT